MENTSLIALKRAHPMALLRVGTGTSIRKVFYVSSIMWPINAVTGLIPNSIYFFLFISFFLFFLFFRPKITTKYPVLTHRTTSFIGPIPSPILHEESRLKTRKIPFTTPFVTASLPFSASSVSSEPQVVIRDAELPDSPVDGFRISSVVVGVASNSQNSLPFSSS